MKTRAACKDYCPLYNTIDRDCEAMGELHSCPRKCIIFRITYKELYDKMIDEDKREVKDD